MQCKNERTWNIILFFFYLIILVGALYPLYRIHGEIPYSISIFDTVLIIFATFRIVRLFVYDHIMQFFRDIFIEKDKKFGECYDSGFRASVTHLLACPWCMSTWAAFFVVFFYFLTPLAWFPIFVVAISGFASLLQITTNLVGWGAEKTKQDAARYEVDHTH